VQRECLAIAERMDVPCWRRNVALQVFEATATAKRRCVRSGEPGQSDLYGWLPAWSNRPGVHWECEVKRPGEAPTYDQTLWLRRCNEATGAAFWADNAETFARVLQALCDGGRIIYVPEAYVWKDFRVPVPGSRTRTMLVVGPSYEYDVI
jgi:hypothetical protein